MSLAAVTAKARGVALHLARADTGGVYCGLRGERLRGASHTWTPEEATCKQCLARYKATKRTNQL